MGPRCPHCSRLIRTDKLLRLASEPLNSRIRQCGYCSAVIARSTHRPWFLALCIPFFVLFFTVLAGVDFERPTVYMMLSVIPFAIGLVGYVSTTKFEEVEL